MHDQFDCQREFFFKRTQNLMISNVRTCITMAHTIYKTLQNLIGTGDRQKIQRL